MNITENTDEVMLGEPFKLVNIGTRSSAIKNGENEIFITHNDTEGKMHLSLVPVYPTIKNITTQPISLVDATM